MRPSWIAVALLAAIAAVGCGDEEASEEAKRWYRPWFLDEGSEGTPEDDEGLANEAEELAEPPTVAAEPVAAPEAGAAGMVAEAVDGPEGEARLVTIKVQRGETVRMYSQWSSVSGEELKALNEMGQRSGLRIGQPFQLMLTPQAYRSFTEARSEHFTQQEKAFFARFEVVKLDRYTVRRGDNIWKISKLHASVPVWVLEKFNSNMNLAKLRVGEELLVPVLNELAQADSSAAEELFVDNATRARARQGGAAGNQRQGPGQPTQEAAAGITVTVSKRETLGHYAKWSGVSITAIVGANPGLNKDIIRLGQQIRVPIPDSKLTAFYRERRRFNGTPPPADVAPLRPVRAAAVARRGKRAERRQGKASQPGAPARAVRPRQRPTEQEPDSAAPREEPIAEAQPAPAAVPAPVVKHRVAPGETAWLIAIRQYKISLQSLRTANPGKDLNRLQVGDMLTIPIRARQPGGDSAHRTP